jgi:hypothetical protein
MVALGHKMALEEQRAWNVLLPTAIPDGDALPGHEMVSLRHNGLHAITVAPGRDSGAAPQYRVRPPSVGTGAVLDADAAWSRPGTRRVARPWQIRRAQSERGQRLFHASMD